MPNRVSGEWVPREPAAGWQGGGSAVGGSRIGGRGRGRGGRRGGESEVCASQARGVAGVDGDGAVPEEGIASRGGADIEVKVPKKIVSLSSVHIHMDNRAVGVLERAG